MTPRILFSILLVLFSCNIFADELPAEGTPDPSVRPAVWLGFPIFGRDRQPPEINLAKDQSLGSAFLLQLRRQALLMTARDEFGAATRDAFLDEDVPEAAVRIDNIDTFPDVAAQADPKYVDHRSYLAELETLSRTKFVAELEKRGLVKSMPPKRERGEEFDKERTEIEKLLRTWALIPQFDALRRTHEAIRKHGESPELLALLVRGYTQMQIQTNRAPRDSHRVFQARSMLYAQRLVAKYGETSEHLSLRAAAWSLNNFHRLARQEFENIADKDSKNSWTEAARLYADFDFKGLETLIEAADPKTTRPLAQMLYFFLLRFSNSGQTLGRPFGEEAIADLPDCSRFYTDVYRLNSFNMLRAPDGSPFHEHLARRIAPAVDKMYDIPDAVKEAAKTFGKTVKKPTGVFFGLFGGAAPQTAFPLEQYFIDLAALIESMRNTPLEDDRTEPSFQALAMLLQDETMQTVQGLCQGIQGRNGAPETLILPALPVLATHPSIEYLGLTIRKQELKTPYWHRLSVKSSVPYNIYSQHTVGFSTNVFDSGFHGRFYSPYFFACLFNDRENVRDMIQYHRTAITDYPKGKHYFLADLLPELCPNNPFAAAIRLARTDGLGAEDAEAYFKKFGDVYPGARLTVIEFYEKHDMPENLIEFIKSGEDSEANRSLANHLMETYLKLGDRKKAVECLEDFMKTEQADRALNRAGAALKIGKILLQDGQYEKAKPYYQEASRTHSAWGLRCMSEYSEVVGRFDEAEQYRLDKMQSYSKTLPTGWWGCCYRTNRPNAQVALDALLDRFARNKAANIMDTTTLSLTKTPNSDILYSCYCMGVPFPEQLGKDPLADELLLGGNGVFGFLAYFEALEKGDAKKADRLLNLIRELWFLEEKTDPFILKQRTVLPKISKRLKVNDAYRMLAALIQRDRQSAKPGAPAPEEIDFIVRANYIHDLDVGRAPWLLYLIGRYYASCGDTEKALDCYRRTLGFRVDFNQFLRSLSVRELRKNGMTDDDYVRYSQGDPKISRFKISRKTADVFCRQHFRDYSALPSESVLSRSVAENPVTATSSGKTTPIAPGWYKVTKILFRGEAISDRENVVYWRIPDGSDTDDADWSSQGIAHCSDFQTKRKERLEDGCYPLRLGALPALASFHGDRMALVVSLKPDEEPTTMLPKPDSNFVRIEMKKVADIPVPEPMIPVAETHTDQKRLKVGATIEPGDDSEAKKWIGHTRLIILGVSVLAITGAIMLSFFGKKKSR